MSYDVALFFRDATFPLQQWKEVMAEFHPQEREIRRSAHNQNVLAEWTISYNRGNLSLELRDVQADRYYKPVPAHWEVFVNRGGHRPHDVWLQFAVPHRALVLLREVKFYDLQHDVHIEDEHEYLEFVAPKLRKFGLSKMFELGLLDVHGNPIF